MEMQKLQEYIEQHQSFVGIEGFQLENLSFYQEHLNAKLKQFAPHEQSSTAMPLANITETPGLLGPGQRHAGE